ncbi:hypothetical protein AB0O34_29180 [Sphaerisporangium sp. NPDC088356]|uniref:hypothetical protein n=1 Tax=Sphaerisporangium sp. NPDC088356 TaxID=3154871 RepID=UPI00344268F7
MISLAMSLYSSPSTQDGFNYQMPVAKHVRVRPHRRLRITRTRPDVAVVIEGPWSAAASNTIVIPRELTMEEEFDLVAAETLAWAEATLPITAETWGEE